LPRLGLYFAEKQAFLGLKPLCLTIKFVSYYKKYRMTKDWQPVENFIIKEDSIRRQIHTAGATKVGNIGKEAIDALKNVFNERHQITENGMFYSLYSKDVQYRKETSSIIFNTLKSIFDKYFVNYKCSFNLFIIKSPNTNEEFFIHQDPSYVDELIYSPLHVWIPLDDITANNGALCFAPKSHNFFGPYRNISFDPPYENIRPFIRQYLEPVFMKAGEMLFFDPRLLNNSLPNSTSEARVVILCGLFPEQAEIISCYKDQSVDSSPVELYRQSEDFFTIYPDFFDTCKMRPTMGEHIGTLEYGFDLIDEKQFAELCEVFGVPKVNFLKEEDVPTCRMFSEPVNS